ncbi:hypothetical protein [Hansschlegelia sp.]|uniref:hypothetical protein n=1 Tax=Hansschlegelia sp. TaxID=2041892 RepID=UPI002BBEA34D|nr:hypothetical protein [Hansschlegelia sp.]HVI27233.1 hypothetical protein [Hansschlegelia sp.]
MAANHPIPLDRLAAAGALAGRPGAEAPNRGEEPGGGVSALPAADGPAVEALCPGEEELDAEAGFVPLD